MKRQDKTDNILHTLKRLKSLENKYIFKLDLKMFTVGEVFV